MNLTNALPPNRVVGEWWDAVRNRDTERFRDLYHPDSPERDASFWTNEDWWESFPPDVLASSTVEERTLVEESDTEATVLDEFATPAEEGDRQPAGLTHKLRAEDGDWRLWTHESREFIYPGDAPDERPADDLPDDCPTSTLADYSPPDELSREAVGTFVIEYHEAYVLDEMFSPTHEDDSVSGSVTSIDSHEYGYVVTVGWGGADYRDVPEIEAKPTTDPPDFDIPSVETLDSKLLREFAREAAERNERVESNGAPHSDLEPVRHEFESLPGTEDGRFISVDGTPVTIQFDIRRTHGDYLSMSTRYYVDSHVVRQSDEHRASDEDTDPRQSPLLECQP
ncbi:nuclear transport factor 2 family protein [Halorubrum sp. SS5]|nr:nuclear transport factor 2 family protein [Halorubrum sp. SS5]